MGVDGVSWGLRAVFGFVMLSFFFGFVVVLSFFWRRFILILWLFFYCVGCVFVIGS